MNYLHEKMVTDYCNWMDKQIEAKFPLSESDWEQVAKAIEKIVKKFPKVTQPEVLVRLHEVYRKWDLKELQMMKAQKEHGKTA